MFKSSDHSAQREREREREAFITIGTSVSANTILIFSTCSFEGNK